MLNNAFCSIFLPNSIIYFKSAIVLKFPHLPHPSTIRRRKRTPFNLQNYLVSNKSNQFATGGARDGAVVRALASHHCGLGSNPGVDAVSGLSLLLVLSFAPRGFSPGTPVFPSPQKPTFPNCNSARNLVDEEPFCGCDTSKSLYVIFFIYL